VGTWKEQYRLAVHGQGSMLRLIGCGMIAVQDSGNAALRSRIAAERVVAPYVLCDALDTHGVPAPTDGVSPITVEDSNAPT
jgi:hypothetical protein